MRGRLFPEWRTEMHPYSHGTEIFVRPFVRSRYGINLAGGLLSHMSVVGFLAFLDLAF